MTKKETPQIPLMNEGLGELMCRRHFFIVVKYPLSLISTSFTMKKCHKIGLMYVLVKRIMEIIWKIEDLKKIISKNVKKH